MKYYTRSLESKLLALGFVKEKWGWRNIKFFIKQLPENKKIIIPPEYYGSRVQLWDDNSKIQEICCPETLVPDCCNLLEKISAEYQKKLIDQLVEEERKG